MHRAYIVHFTVNNLSAMLQISNDLLLIMYISTDNIMIALALAVLVHSLFWV